MLRSLVLALSLGLSLAACAQPAGNTGTPAATAPAAPGAAARPGEEAVRAALAGVLPGNEIRRLRPAPFAGFQEVVIAGRVLYVSDDGRYAIDGALIDLADRRNLTESAMDEVRVQELKRIPAEKRIVFAPREPKYTVTVFTDIDCGYCRMFHQHMAEYNALGIAVEYLFFPRAGQGSAPWQQAEAVWCSKDPRQAMTEAKGGKTLPAPPAGCKSPVAEEYALGREVGVNATPAVFAPSGAQIGGYLEPQRLLQALEQDARRQAQAPQRSDRR